MKILNCDCRDYIKSDEFKDIATSGKLHIVTDPPFNIGYKYRSYKDRMKEGEYFYLLKEVFTATYCPFIVVMYPETMHRLSVDMGECPSRVVSWVYNSNTAKQHRDIGFYRICPDMNRVRQPYKNPNDKRIRERIARGIEGGKLYDWWDINQVKNVSKKGLSHPCVMPLEVMDRIVRLLPDDAIIFDPFSGSGTTGLACMMNGREYIGCELDPIYCEEQRERLERFKRS